MKNIIIILMILLLSSCNATMKAKGWYNVHVTYYCGHEVTIQVYNPVFRKGKLYGKTNYWHCITGCEPGSKGHNHGAITRTEFLTHKIDK